MSTKDTKGHEEEIAWCFLRAPSCPSWTTLLLASMTEQTRRDPLNSRHAQRPARSVQRRRDRDHHHHHGAGASRTALDGPGKPAATRSGFAQLPVELHLHRHLLE